MVFGCISWRGKLFFKILEQNVDSKYYMSYLPEAWEACRVKYPNTTWKWQQDNASSHKSDETWEFIKQSGIKFIHHPPQSTDLHPIEWVWSFFKHRLERYAPKNLEELKLFSKKAWDSIPHFLIRKCVQRLRKVMLNVKKSDGSYILFPQRTRKKVNYFEEGQSEYMMNDPDY